MKLKFKEILYPSIIFFIFYFATAFIVVIDRFSGGFYLSNFSYFVFAPGFFGIDVLGGTGLIMELVYLVIISIISSFMIFLLVKLYCKKKRTKLTPKKVIILSLVIVISITLLFALISWLGGTPNYISIEVKDSETNNLTKNVSMQFIEWKGNFLEELPCKQDMILKDGKLKKFQFSSTGFSSYFNDKRYYQEYFDHKFFTTDSIYLTKKTKIQQLPGNYEENLAFSNDYFIGCINGNPVGFDFSRGRPVDAEAGDIMLDVSCEKLNFRNNDKLMQRSNIIAVDNASIILDTKHRSFFSLTKAPETGFEKAAKAEMGNNYFVKTRGGNYAKFKIDIMESSLGGRGTNYSKFTIFWAYQPDGSRSLATEDYFVFPWVMGNHCK